MTTKHLATAEAINDMLNCTSWISRKYRNGEINTAYSYVIVTKPGLEQPEYYWQGEEADKIADEVLHIWLTEGDNQAGAFNKWIDRNLI